MITKFNTQLFDISMNSYTLANTAGANGQISYNYETGKLYVHDGFGNKFSNTLVQTGPTYQFQGENYGYTSGGNGPTIYTSVEKFPLPTANPIGAVIGNLTPTSGVGGAGASSGTYSYVSGGVNPYLSTTDAITKMAFSSDSNYSDTAELTQSIAYAFGHSSDGKGYVSAGSTQYATPQWAQPTTISSFPFASDASATNNTGTTLGRYAGGASNSPTHGYLTGGRDPSNNATATIQKFPFTSDDSITNIGNGVSVHYISTGLSSSTYGYVFGGFPGTLPSTPNVLEKFSFSSDSPGLSIGSLATTRYGIAGVSAQDYGYGAGGYNHNSLVYTNIIDSTSFSSDTNSITVGSLNTSRQRATGTQY